MMYPVGEDPEGPLARTRALLRSLGGRI
jgi:hypothetical protein